MNGGEDGLCMDRPDSGDVMRGESGALKGPGQSIGTSTREAASGVQGSDDSEQRGVCELCSLCFPFDSRSILPMKGKTGLGGFFDVRSLQWRRCLLSR